MSKYYLRDWKEVIDLNHPELILFDRTREQAIEYAKSHCVGDMRIATGRFYTAQEFEEYKRRILSAFLP